MTLFVSVLFGAALLLAVFSMSVTIMKAMPRIEQVISERNLHDRPQRIIKVGPVNTTVYRAPLHNIVQLKQPVQSSRNLETLFDIKIAA